jgi:hypothetical protein
MEDMESDEEEELVSGKWGGYDGEVETRKDYDYKGL